jgi:ATP-binding cassette subfamily C protein LapB
MTDIAAEINPVSQMMTVLQQSGRENFVEKNQWESSLCALLLALEPRCRTYRLLEALPYDSGKMTQQSTLNTFAHLGYFARPVKTQLRDIEPRLLPCLFIGDSARPVIILEQKAGHLKVYANGHVRKISKGDMAAETGEAWIFERYEENRAVTSKFMRAGSGKSWFSALLGRFRSTFGQILLACFMLNVIALSTPLFIMLIYDRVIAAGAPEILPMLAVGACIAIGFEWVLRRTRSQGLSWLAARMDNIVGNKIFAHLIGLPPSLIERASVAAQIARIKTFESVRDYFSGSVFLSMLELPFVVIAALAIYAVAGPLVLVPLAMIACYGLLFWAIHKKVKIAIRLAAKASSARQQFAIETFEKIQGVRGNGLSKTWQAKFRELSGREMLAHFRLNWLGMMAETTAHAITLIAAVATVGFGVHMIWAGMMSTGALVATMILVWRVLTPFYSLCTMIPRLEQLRNSIMQVNKLMDIDTEAMEAVTAARLPKMRGQVSFKNAGINYGEDTDPVFNNLTFDARPGDFVIVTGENGSGKTTLLKLIKGLYKTTSGAVQIDGFDIRQLDAPDLRRQIAYIPQHADFFQGTIFENLRLGNPMASQDDIEKALQMADVWNEIAALPAGLGTVIGRYGADALPSSLATRLSLARAYLHTAPILLIDELPNALLSSRAGKNLKDYLARTKGKRTCIMVSYREDFINLADTLVVLRRGETPMAGARETITETINKQEAA